MRLYPLFRPALFALDPERAHNFAISALDWAGRTPGIPLALRAIFGFEHAALRTVLWGRELSNPVGLAAGFDKDARGIDALAALGFGLIEVGTVTPRPQPGNPRPRLFRLPEDQAVVNRLGFNSGGIGSVLERIREAHHRDRVGVNLGKNRDTPNDRSAEDYLAGLRALPGDVAYATINISSPNTPGLRDLQHRDSLRALLSELTTERGRRARSAPHVPLLVKIAPDLDQTELADIAEIAMQAGIDGLVATNTTTARPVLFSRYAGEPGGLSGRPLFPKSLATVRALRRLTKGRIPLVGVGGIFTAEDAYAMIRAGANAVQLYTGLIYRGPGLVKDIKQGLVRLLERDGFSNIAQAVGADLDLDSSGAAPSRESARSPV
jgi:dihydroorotate dehydrogenase